MSIGIATILVSAAKAYVVAGLLFAFVFLRGPIVRVDPRVGSSPRGLRLLLLPGVAVLWPVLATRWWSGAAPPEERTPHRRRHGAAATEGQG